MSSTIKWTDSMNLSLVGEVQRILSVDIRQVKSDKKDGVAKNLNLLTSFKTAAQKAQPTKLAEVSVTAIFCQYEAIKKN